MLISKCWAIFFITPITIWYTESLRWPNLVKTWGGGKTFYHNFSYFGAISTNEASTFATFHTANFKTSHLHFISRKIRIGAHVDNMADEMDRFFKFLSVKW